MNYWIPKYRMYWLWLVIALAGVRFWFVLPNMFLNGDAALRYDPLGWNIAQGNGFSTSQSPPYTPDLFDVPLYPLFLAAIYVLIGHNLIAVGCAQILLELATIALVLRIGSHMGLNRSEEKWVVLIGLISPFLVVFCTTALSEMVATFMLALAVFVFLKCADVTGTKAIPWWSGAGLVAGLAYQVRPDLVLGIAPMIMIVFGSFCSKRRYKDSLIFLTLVGFSIAATLTPWTIRNSSTTSEFILPGERQFTHGFQSEYGSYREWLDTWAHDPRLVHPCWWDVVYKRSVETFPLWAIPNERERGLAEEALSELGRTKSFSGLPESVFAELADDAKKTRPAQVYIVTPAKRLIKSWTLVPSYGHIFFELESTWNLAKVYFYLGWLIVLTLAGLGIITRFRINVRDTMLMLSVIAGLSVLPLISLCGTEPRFLAKGLPCVYLFAGVGVASIIRNCARFTFTPDSQSVPVYTEE